MSKQTPRAGRKPKGELQICTAVVSLMTGMRVVLCTGFNIWYCNRAGKATLGGASTYRRYGARTGGGRLEARA